MDRGEFALLLNAWRAAAGGRLMPIAVQLRLSQPQRGDESQVCQYSPQGVAVVSLAVGGFISSLQGCLEKKILCPDFVSIIFPVALHSSFICRGLASENTVS